MAQNIVSAAYATYQAGSQQHFYSELERVFPAGSFQRQYPVQWILLRHYTENLESAQKAFGPSFTVDYLSFERMFFKLAVFRPGVTQQQITWCPFGIQALTDFLFDNRGIWITF